MKLGSKISLYALALSVTAIQAYTENIAYAQSRQCDTFNVGSGVTIDISNADIDVTLKIPVRYILSKPIYDGQVRDAVLLKIPREEIFRIADSTAPPNDLPVGQWQTEATLLITAFSPLDEVAEAYTDFPIYDRKIDLNGIGLKYLPDLQLYSPNEKPKPRFVEVFLGKDLERVVDVITCRQIGDVKYPSCTYLLESNQLDIKLSFTRNDLSAWRAYRRAADIITSCIVWSDVYQKEE